MGEPILGTLTGKLIASLAADAIKQAGKSFWKYYHSADELTIPDRAILSEITDLVNLQIGSPLGSVSLTQSLREYLRSPECVTALEHIFAFKLSGRAVLADGPLAKEVGAGCAYYGVAEVEDQQTTFNVLAATVDLILTQAGVVRNEALSESATKTANAIAVEAYLRSIDGQLGVLTGAAPLSSPEIASLIERYQSALTDVVGSIQPPNFDGAESVPIDDLYVQPALLAENEAGQKFELTVRGLLDLSRAVVLGNPGGGKTTLTSKIAYDMAQNSVDEARRGDQQLIPIIIVLRDFGRFLARTPGSVAEFIVEMFRTQYQVTVTTPTIEWILAAGRAYVIFDGLDELLETDHRKRIAQIVTSFAAVYTNCNILVTSRKVGYKQAPLAGNVFQVVSLGDFQKDQVSQYVTNWFNLLTKLPQSERESLAAQFMGESAAAEDLRQNPLMLALMCTIYRSESYIPRNRPDVYEKCSKMLFDRWDRHRGILEPFEFEAHVEPALMHLAHTIYTTGSGESGVTEAQLIGFATQYLHKWQYEDEAIARHAAGTFVRFCKGRAWVFSDVGLSPGDEVLYQFTHRTFLEYFTACHLSRTIDGVAALCEFLLPNIKRSEWDVVAQLALQLKAKSMEGGPDKVATFLIDASRADTESRTRIGILGFLRRCMTFLPTSPRITRRICRELVRVAIDETASDDERLRAGVLVGDNMSINDVTREVRELFGRSLADELIAALESGAGEKLRHTAGVAWAFLDEAGNALASDVRQDLEQMVCPIMLQHMAQWP